MSHRPSLYDGAVIDFVASRVLDKYLAQVPLDEGEDRDHLLSVMREAIDACIWELDGFKIAEYLSARGWNMDATIVEVLDCAHWLRHGRVEELVKTWVAENSIKPALKVGDRVRCNAGTPEFPRWEDGEIVKIREDTAQYVVKTAHTERVNQQPGVHSFGTIYNYENCELIKE